MSTPRRPPGRYDERRPLPRGVLIGGTTLLVTGLAVLSYLAYDRFSGDRVRFGTLGYEVVDDRHVTVRFEVRKPVLESAVCSVQARDRQNVVVGRDTVTVGPADREAVVTSRTLTTTGLAATGEVVGCSPVPDSP